MSSGGRGIKTLLEQIVERPLNRWVFYQNPPENAQLAITPGPDDACILVNGEEVPR